MQRSEQERLQLALDAAGMGTFVWYAQRDHADPDARMRELFALSPEGELSLAAALTSMIHPDDRNRYATAVGAALDPAGSHELSQEIRVDRGDGTYRWVAVTARAFFSGDPPRPDRLVGVAADVTRRRAIEDALREAEDRRAFLLELTDGLRGLTDPVEVQTFAVGALGARFGVSRALYFEVSPGTDGDDYTIQRDYRAGGVPSMVGRHRADDFGATLFEELRAGRTLVVADVADEPALTGPERASHAAVGIRAYVSVPLIKDGRHVAGLVLQHAEPRAWTAAEVTLVEEVAERTWAAVERAKAEAELRASEARAREEEHRVALVLQRALLPAATVARADAAIAARYESGSSTLEVGGDWYDTFEMPDGAIALTVGDVVGHGLAAATTMGKLRIAVRALAPHAAGPGALLTHLDGFAAGSHGIDFATACFATFQPRTGELRHASAGHPPMLVVTPGGATKWLTAGRSAPITGRKPGPRPDATETLEAGSLLLLYSDGLVERRREPLSAGLERLERAAAELRHLPGPELCDKLLAALGVAGHREDDVVVLCLRMVGTVPEAVPEPVPDPVPDAAAVPFHETLAADLSELSRLRRSLRMWWRGLRRSGHGEPELLLAVHEACANAVEHAYRDGGPGTIEVTVVPEADGSLLATVRDFGTWRPAPERSGAPASAMERGRGLSIIRDISRDFACRLTGDGTIVQFRLPVTGVTR